MEGFRPSRLALLKGILLLPFTALFMIPLILHIFLGYSFILGPGLSLLAISLGFVLLATGIILAIKTMSLFFNTGKGTPAPWDPPKKLVNVDIYSRMRNPMITGAMLIILGEALVIGSLTLLVYALVFFIGNHFYFILYEEPILERRFGKSYTRYKEKVPRWIPKIGN